MATTKVLCPLLVNGIEMRRQHPDTFEVPPVYIKQQQAPGCLVKVSAKAPGILNGRRTEYEKFWVEITKAEYPIFEGRIDNELITDSLKYNDIIKFHADNILAIYES
jgi:hypothetical protein